MDWISNSWAGNYIANDVSYYGFVVKRKDGTFSKNSGNYWNVSGLGSDVDFVTV